MIEHNVSFHSSILSDAQPDKAPALSSIANCPLALNKRLNNHFLKLNGGKTKVLPVGPKTKRELLLSNLGETKSVN